MLSKPICRAAVLLGIGIAVSVADGAIRAESPNEKKMQHHDRQPHEVKKTYVSKEHADIVSRLDKIVDRLEMLATQMTSSQHGRTHGDKRDGHASRHGKHGRKEHASRQHFSEQQGRQHREHEHHRHGSVKHSYGHFAGSPRGHERGPSGPPGKAACPHCRTMQLEQRGNKDHAAVSDRRGHQPPRPHGFGPPGMGPHGFGPPHPDDANHANRPPHAGLQMPHGPETANTRQLLQSMQQRVEQEMQQHLKNMAEKAKQHLEAMEARVRDLTKMVEELKRNKS